MGRIIAIASGKGGVGKTTLTANLGLAIAKLGKKTVMVDADLDMANLELVLGMEGRPITLQDVLSGEAVLEDATYEVIPNGYFIPAGISPSQFKRVDPEKLSSLMKELGKSFDFVLLDVPAGIGRDAIACFSASKETILIVTPDPLSIADAYKTSVVASKMGSELIGIIMNFITGSKKELSEKDITSILDAPVIGKIKTDEKIAESVIKGKPIITNDPESEPAKEIMKIASRLTGIAYIEEKHKKSLLSKLFGFLKR